MFAFLDRCVLPLLSSGARRRAALTAVLATLGASAACSDSSAPGEQTLGSVFVVRVNGEDFRVQATTPALETTLRAHLTSGRIGVLSGRVVAGNGGVNTPYGWHLDPATITTPDVAIEVCDGRPSDVQGNIPYWLNTVRFYCPWGARVVREE